MNLTKVALFNSSLAARRNLKREREETPCLDTTRQPLKPLKVTHSDFQQVRAEGSTPLVVVPPDVFSDPFAPAPSLSPAPLPTIPAAPVFRPAPIKVPVLPLTDSPGATPRLSPAPLPPIPVSRPAPITVPVPVLPLTDSPEATPCLAPAPLPPIPVVPVSRFVLPSFASVTKEAHILGCGSEHEVCSGLYTSPGGTFFPVAVYTVTPLSSSILVPSGAPLEGDFFSPGGGHLVTFQTRGVALNRIKNSLDSCTEIPVLDRSLYLLRHLKKIIQKVDDIHRLGYVHEDLKPSNMVISKTSSFPIDTRDLPRIGESNYFFTRYYHSPLVRGELSAARVESDVYCLGRTFRELIHSDTLRLHFSDLDLLLQDSVLPIQSHRPELWDFIKSIRRAISVYKGDEGTEKRASYYRGQSAIEERLKQIYPVLA